MESRFRSQAVLSLADQAVFSGAMLVVNVLLARWTTPSEYGVFAVLFALFLVLAGFHNALIIEPMSVFGARKAMHARRKYYRHVYLMHAVVAVSLAGIAGIGGLLMDGSALQPARWALPLTVPLAMTFWLARRACYVESNAGQALLLSTLYAVGVMAGIAWLHYTESLSAFSAFVVIGVVGFVVSLPAMVRVFLDRSTSSKLTFAGSVRQHLKYGRWSLSESIAFALGASILPLAIAWFMTVGDAGKFRALQILFLPLTHLTAGLGLMLLPMMSRLRTAADDDHYVSRSRALLVWFVALAIAYVVPVLLFGRSLLTLVYGNAEYLDLVSLLPYLGLSCVMTAATAAMMIVLRSSERPDLVFLATVAGSAAMLTFGIGMIAAFELPGIAAALLLTSGVTAVVLAWAGRAVFGRRTSRIGRHVREGANV